jgi:hypothetical protein
MSVLMPNLLKIRKFIEYIWLNNAVKYLKFAETGVSFGYLYQNGEGEW